MCCPLCAFLSEVTACELLKEWTEINTKSRAEGDTCLVGLKICPLYVLLSLSWQEIWDVELTAGDLKKLLKEWTEINRPKKNDITSRAVGGWHTVWLVKKRASYARGFFFLRPALFMKKHNLQLLPNTTYHPMMGADLVIKQHTCLMCPSFFVFTGDLRCRTDGRRSEKAAQGMN